MALQQQYTNNQGIVLDYWKITNINKNITYKTAQITLSGYLNQEAKTNGCEPIEVRRIKVIWDKYDMYFSVEVLNASTNDIEKAYEYIKANELMFQNSIDV